MAQIVLQDVDEMVLHRLGERAHRHGRTLEEETKDILARAATSDMASAQTAAAHIRTRLSGRQHSESAELVAEDRGR